MPPFVVGMPVAWVKLRFNWVTPKALLHEKLNPGIFVFVITFWVYEVDNSSLTGKDSVP